MFLPLIPAIKLFMTSFFESLKGDVDFVFLKNECTLKV